MMKQCGCKGHSCGCCAGVEKLTPALTANRPGLNTLVYRIGTHAAFFETMQARLSGFSWTPPIPGNAGIPVDGNPLAGLRTRSLSDPSIALLDAAAAMFDVLTFYQERVANEGYLRTAAERRSILELGRLVGYKMPPGVSASVFLAYTLDKNSDPVEIPAGALSQSVPAQNELPQSFETSEKLQARKEWNDLKPRMTRTFKITVASAKILETLYFEGTETNLKPNDPILFVFESLNQDPVLRKIKTVEPLFEEKKTKVTLQFSFDEFKEAVQQLIDRTQNHPERSAIPGGDELITDSIIALTKLKNIQDFTDPGNVFIEVLRFLREKLGQFAQKDDCQAQALINELITTVAAIPRPRKRGICGEELPDDDTHNEMEKDLALRRLRALSDRLSRPASRQPANSQSLGRDIGKVFAPNKDILPQILTSFESKIRGSAYQALGSTNVSSPLCVKIYALRTTAPLFGSTAQPEKLIKDGKTIVIGEHPVAYLRGIEYNGKPNSTANLKDDEESKENEGNEKNAGKPAVVSFAAATVQAPILELLKHEDENAVWLDASYDKILPDSWVVVDMSQVNAAGLTHFKLNGDKIISTISNVSSLSRNEYGISAKATLLKIRFPWITFRTDLEKLRSDISINGVASHKLLDDDFELIRRTVVHAQSEELTLAEEPLSGDICGDTIELGALYEGLRSGRWLIVSGERTDIPDTTGIRGSELVMLAGVTQDYKDSSPGDKIRSTLKFANRLSYTYKRDTVVIYGNVVKATHGETRREVLGSGDAAKPMQTFTLKQPPLTFISAANPEGIDSTLHVRVNDVEWKEVDSLAGLKPGSRGFITKTDDASNTTVVVFGSGEKGARPPTGIENITAVYRNGIGKAGNVKAEQITLLLSKPLGVKEVINPLGASGGADKETRDRARRNVPAALMALDRLVSPKDYAYFARASAGIGKASAAKLFDGHRQVVYLTIAGADDIPIDKNSDLYRNLRIALLKNGDALQPLQIEKRELMALVISANICIGPEYLWEKVEPLIRAALLDAFSFERRELGQNVFLSEVIGVIMRVRGVTYADVDVLNSISETELSDPSKLNAKLLKLTTGAVFPDPAYVKVNLAHERGRDETGPPILPAQLAFLLPDIPDTLILNKIAEVKR